MCKSDAPCSVENFRTLVLDGVDKVQQGLTSVEEVLSVANAAQGCGKTILINLYSKTPPMPV